MKKVIVIALGLIVLIAIPVLAQESEKSMEDQMMEMQEKMMMMPAVPNISVAANVQVKVGDSNFNSIVDPEGVHFSTGDVNATVTFKGEADGTGMMLGKTTAELKMKFDGAADPATVAQDGAWLKVAGLMGLPIDMAGYALKAAATTTLDPVKVEAPGIGIDILAGPLTVKTIFNSVKSTVVTFQADPVDSSTADLTKVRGAKDDPTLYAGSVNVEFPLPDIVTISGGVSFAQKDPQVVVDSTKAENKVLDLGVGAKADLKMVPDLALPISFGMKILNRRTTDLSKTDVVGVTGIKVDVPVEYTLGDLKAKLGVAYATYSWVQEVDNPGEITEPITSTKIAMTYTDELKVTPGAEFALSDLGITAKLDVTLYVMVPSLTADVGGTKTTVVDPGGKSGDYGNYDAEVPVILTKADGTNFDPGLFMKIVPAVEIKTGIVTTAISLTYQSDANIDATSEIKDDGSRIGFEIVWKAGF